MISYECLILKSQLSCLSYTILVMFVGSHQETARSVEQSSCRYQKALGWVWGAEYGRFWLKAAAIKKREQQLKLMESDR